MRDGPIQPEGAGVVFEAPYAEAWGEVFWAVSPVPPSVGWVLTAEEGALHVIHVEDPPLDCKKAVFFVLATRYLCVSPCELCSRQAVMVYVITKIAVRVQVILNGR